MEESLMEVHYPLKKVAQIFGDNNLRFKNLPALFLNGTIFSKVFKKSFKFFYFYLKKKKIFLQKMFFYCVHLFKNETPSGKIFNYI